VSDATTRGVRVQVRASYLPDRSAPRQGQYLFSYEVRISNVGDETVQLVSRHWVITDGEGRVEHVRGPGVVGEQPVLSPGASFEYTSFCPLADRLDARRVPDGRRRRLALRRRDRALPPGGPDGAELGLG
jgi:ApaG protein